MLRLQCIHYSD